MNQYNLNETTQIIIPVENEPGSLFRLTNLLKPFNISGLTSDPSWTTTNVKFTIDGDYQPALGTLKAAGYASFIETAYWVELPNTPGALVGFIELFGANNVNIGNIYNTALPGTEMSKLVFTVQDPVNFKNIWNTKLVAEKAQPVAA